MSKRRIILIVLSWVAFLVAAGMATAYYTYRNFGALVAELPESPELAALTAQHFAEGEARLGSAKDEYDRWVHLGYAALGNGILGDPARADALADELLAMAPRYTRDWNYGNAIHYAHLAHGHAALARGDLQAARASLLAAGDTPGSPQLNTFGPKMNLARELLRRNERETVLAYIEKLRRFWEMDRGALDKWVEMIREGRTPNFAFNLY